ncbi:MAG TPA: hypothetical protein VGM88_07215 [Kofleriaceae bacterium]|jgi:hypothetical protein
MRFLLVVGIAAAASCGGKAGPTGGDPTPKAVVASVPASSGAVELGEMTIYEGKEVMARLHADGSTELATTDGSGAAAFQPGPVIKADGTFADKSGAAHSRLNPNGTITDLDSNQPLPITVTIDSVTIIDQGQQNRITLGADGTINLPQPQPPEHTPHVEGADTPGKRRVVLALMGIMLLPDDK